MGRLSEAHDEMQASWSELREHWADVREQWRDAVGQRFEREWWQQLEDVVPRWLEALAELDEVSERVLLDTEE